jgi:FAD/FMN-containing dehydrogenase
MCMIKQALDPLNIMNRGKVFLDTPAAAKAAE